MRQMPDSTKKIIQDKFHMPAEELVQHVFSTPNAQLTTEQRKFKMYYLCWERDAAVEDLKKLSAFENPLSPTTEVLS